jgi:hypothetical protein
MVPRSHSRKLRPSHARRQLRGDVALTYQPRHRGCQARGRSGFARTLSKEMSTRAETSGFNELDPRDAHSERSHLTVIDVTWSMWLRSWSHRAGPCRIGWARRDPHAHLVSSSLAFRRRVIFDTRAGSRRRPRRVRSRMCPRGDRALIQVRPAQQASQRLRAAIKNGAGDPLHAPTHRPARPPERERIVSADAWGPTAIADRSKLDRRWPNRAAIGP